MFTALTIDNRKIEPSPNVIAFCGNCGTRVIPRAADPSKEYLVHKHFSHHKGVCCDDWYEPVSDWHFEWQSHVPIEQREVSIEHGIIRHIADIFLPIPNVVVELQKSHIPFDIKLKRDGFYNRIIWIVHETLSHETWVTSSNKPIFIDHLNGFLTTPFNTTISKPEFIDTVLNNPNFKYEDWIYGLVDQCVNTRFGKIPLKDIQFGDHLVFKTQTSIVSQCTQCDNPIPQYQSHNDLLSIKSDVFFQCMLCGKIYQAYIVTFDPRGDDQQKDIKEFRLRLNPYGSATKARWTLHKELKYKSVVKHA